MRRGAPSVRRRPARVGRAHQRPDHRVRARRGVHHAPARQAEAGDGEHPLPRAAKLLQVSHRRGRDQDVVHGQHAAPHCAGGAPPPSSPTRTSGASFRRAAPRRWRTGATRRSSGCFSTPGCAVRSCLGWIGGGRSITPCQSYIALICIVLLWFLGQWQAVDATLREIWQALSLPVPTGHPASAAPLPPGT